jgi:hypothetical protein
MEEQLQEHDQNEALLDYAVYKILIRSTYPILSLLCLEVVTTCIATIDLYDGVDVNMYFEFLNVSIAWGFDTLCFKKFLLCCGQRIQYAKTVSDAITKAAGTFVPKEKRKKQEEKGMISKAYSAISSWDPNLITGLWSWCLIMPNVSENVINIHLVTVDVNGWLTWCMFSSVWQLKGNVASNKQRLLLPSLLLLTHLMVYHHL